MISLKNCKCWPAVLLILLMPLSVFSGMHGKEEIKVTSSSDEAVQLFLRGREAFEMGRVGDALSLFDRSLDKDYNLATAWLYKAYAVSAASGRDLCLDKAASLRNSVSEGERLLIDFALAQRENNVARRLELAKGLVKLCPDDVRALLILAGEHQIAGDITKFRDIAQIAIAIHPISPLGYRALGSSLLINEPSDFSLAIKYMRKFVELRPDEPASHLTLGDVLRANLDLVEARDSYSRAIALNPAISMAYSKRGYANSYLGNFDSARNDFQRARDLESNNTEGTDFSSTLVSFLIPLNGWISVPEDATATAGKRFQRGQNYQIEGITPDHYFCCTVISMSNGIYVAPFQGLNECQCLLRQFEQESIVPSHRMMDANFAFVSGLRSIQQGDYELAEEKLNEFASYSSPGLQPRKNQAYNFLAGLLYMNKGLYSKAISSFNKSDINNVCVKYNLGIAYHKEGSVEQAEKMFRAVLDDKFSKTSSSEMTKTAERWLESLASAIEKNR